MSRTQSIARAVRWLPLAAVLLAGAARADSSVIVTDQVFLGDLGAPIFIYGALGEVTPSGAAYEANLFTDVGPPVSVIRLMEVNPEVESEAITRATIS